MSAHICHHHTFSGPPWTPSLPPRQPGGHLQLRLAALRGDSRHVPLLEGAGERADGGAPGLVRRHVPADEGRCAVRGGRRGLPRFSVSIEVSDSRPAHRSTVNYSSNPTIFLGNFGRLLFMSYLRVKRNSMNNFQLDLETITSLTLCCWFFWQFYGSGMDIDNFGSSKIGRNCQNFSRPFQSVEVPCLLLAQLGNSVILFFFSHGSPNFFLPL